MLTLLSRLLPGTTEAAEMQNRPGCNIKPVLNCSASHWKCRTDDDCADGFSCCQSNCPQWRICSQPHRDWDRPVCSLNCPKGNVWFRIPKRVCFLYQTCNGCNGSDFCVQEQFSKSRQTAPGWHRYPVIPLCFKHHTTECATPPIYKLCTTNKDCSHGFCCRVNCLQYCL